ncbi:MAG: LysE family translocator [Pseudomonadota bacterium]
MFEAYLITLLGVVAAQASPGPNLVAVASTSLSQGRVAGLAVVGGVASGMLVWSLATAFGLSVVLELFPASLIALKLLGGAYLLWLAIKGVRSALANRPGAITPTAKPITVTGAYFKGLFVLLTNPKAVLMWAAVSSFLFGRGLSALEVLAFGPVGAFSGLIVYGTYAWLFSTGLAMRSYQRFARWIEFAFAATFGAFGATLVRDALSEARSAQ